MTLPMLMTEDEVKAELAKRIVSRNWWIIIPSSEGMKTLCAFEEKFYSGDASIDFEIMMGMPLLFGIALAHKRRCSPTRMTEFINERLRSADGAPTVDMDTVQKKDILFWAGPGEGQAMGLMLYTWLQDAVDKEMIRTAEFE